MLPVLFLAEIDFVAKNDNEAMSMSVMQRYFFRLGKVPQLLHISKVLHVAV